jgi:class 3 adenylate cyclase
MMTMAGRQGAMTNGSGLSVETPSAVCSNCRTAQPPTGKFCGACGTRLAAAPVSKTAHCSTHRATVLFCDVVGYTAISGRLDPEQVFALMERTFAVVLDAVHRHRGTVNQFLGDGAMALFEGSGHAEQAIAAARRIRDGLQIIADEARDRHGVEFGMRIGIHTGTVAVGAIGVDLRGDYAVSGSTVRVASSLLRLGRRGEIVVTEATRGLAEAGDFEPRGDVAGDAGERIAVYTAVDGVVATLGWRYDLDDAVEVPDALYA